MLHCPLLHMIFYGQHAFKVEVFGGVKNLNSYNRISLADVQYDILRESPVDYLLLQIVHTNME